MKSGATEAEAERDEGARMRKEVLINNSRWRRIRKRVKSIGVMTRGKAEAKYFPSRWENLRFRDREREMCGERGEIEEVEEGEREKE